MTLGELESAYRDRLQRHGEPVVIVAMQIPEKDIRSLRPRLEKRHESLSEHVRKLIRQNVSWEG